MSGYLLDTNIVSEYSKPSPPSPIVSRWVDAQDEDTLHLSVLTLGEIRKGTTLLPPGSKHSYLERWLEVELPARFASRLLIINGEIAETWGAMAGYAQLNGIAMPAIDGLIAATAKFHGLTIVTRNVKDYRIWEVPVLNPWDSA